MPIYSKGRALPETSSADRNVANSSKGHCTAHSAPDTRVWRLAFGVHTSRKVRTSGITVLGVRYNSDTLAAWCLHNLSKDIELIWDAENIGAIEVCLSGNWFEVPSVCERFDGVNARVWLKVCRSLRARPPGRKEWAEDAVLKAKESN